MTPKHSRKPPPTRAELETREVLSTTEAAVLADTSLNAVMDWITRGLTIFTARERRLVRLRARKVGGRWRINRADLDAYLLAVTTDNHQDAFAAGETAAEFRDQADEDERAVRELLGG